MGQGPSQETVSLETRIEDPKNTPPRGLALIAHGRLGGTFDQPPVRLLAEYLRDTQQLRVVTWNARGMGQSGGGNEWSNFGVWLGDAGVFDYKVFVTPIIKCNGDQLGQIFAREAFVANLLFL